MRFQEFIICNEYYLSLYISVKIVADLRNGNFLTTRRSYGMQDIFWLFMNIWPKRNLPESCWKNNLNTCVESCDSIYFKVKRWRLIYELSDQSAERVCYLMLFIDILIIGWVSWSVLVHRGHINCVALNWHFQTWP